MLGSTISWENFFLGITLAFVLGALVGSFLNVCLHRLPRGQSILWPGSRCGNCWQPLRWYDNVPLLSYWVLRGHCRTCGMKFSSCYFWVELLTAIGYAGLFCLECLLYTPGATRSAGWLEIGQVLPIGWLLDALALTLLIIAAGLR